MSVPVIAAPADRLAKLGLYVADKLHYQLPPSELVRQSLQRREGELNDTGALVIQTGTFTGRCPKDRYIVKDETTADTVHWNDFNQPMEESHFDIFFGTIRDWLNQLPEVWVRDCYVCADPRFRLNIRVVNETPSTNLFAYNMFLRPTEDELDNFVPDWQILSAPGLQLDAAHCGTRSSNAVAVSFRHRLILLAGTG